MIEPLITFWPFGGTGVTRFSEDDRPIYERAILEFGDPSLYIVDGNIGLTSGKVVYGSCLCHKEHSDLSAFWDIFDRIKKPLTPHPKPEL